MIRLDKVFKFYRIDRHRKIVLDHVSISFESGHSYGILGVNGAGKSTLVRLIGGSEYPNSGRVQRTVRVSWPLGLASCLHPALTGRENIQFVARAYGEDIRKTIDLVEDFAEVGPYLDAPVKSYSSGMLQRVAFGLSMAIKFDCYLIDEVFAVGDARFQARCRSIFRSRAEFADLILVSHDMASIQEYCDRGVVLSDGRLFSFRNVADAIGMYKRLNM
jgi:capsular polysaccharide transport system ATP-binding protein